MSQFSRPTYNDYTVHNIIMAWFYLFIFFLAATKLLFSECLGELSRVGHTRSQTMQVYIKKENHPCIIYLFWIDLNAKFCWYKF
jgi:hypothetical protein